jgi:hypothetical protein
MSGGADDLVEIIKIAGGPTAVVALGWWLRGKFSDVVESGRMQLVIHEKQDEKRHRQNLVRFAKINMKLGIDDFDETNGNHEE